MDNICRICKESKEESEFPDKWSKRKDGWIIIGKRNECRECSNKRRRRLYIKDPRTGILSNIKQRVRKYDLEFNLALEDIIIPDKCPILNIPLERGTKGKYRYSPTADRIDNNKGYIKGNIRIISMQANKMKNDATVDELSEFSKNILKYINNDIV